jgi:hypothetical protein
MRRILLATGIAGVLVAGAQPAVAQDHAGGCKENGQAVSTAARAPGPFGQFVRENVPINDDVALFKTIFCGP